MDRGAVCFRDAWAYDCRRSGPTHSGHGKVHCAEDRPGEREAPVSQTTRASQAGGSVVGASALYTQRLQDRVDVRAGVGGNLPPLLSLEPVKQTPGKD